MDGILIYRSLSSEEIAEVTRLHSQGAAMFVDSSQQLQGGLQKLESAAIQMSEQAKDQISRKLIQRVLAFGDREVLGKSCKEHLQMDTTSIWYYHKYRIFLDMARYKNKIAEINEYAQSYDELYVYSSGLDGAKIEANVKLLAGPGKKRKLNNVSVLRYALLFIRRAFSGLFQLKVVTPAHKNLIISNPKVEVPYMSRSTFKEEPDDLYLGYLMQQVDSSFLFLDDLTPPKFSLSSSFEVKPRYLSNPHKRAQINTDYIMLRALFSIRGIGNVFKIKNQLKLAYETLENNIMDDLHLDIVKRLKRLNSTSLYLAFKFYAFQLFFNNNQFKTITAQDENNTSTKVILDAAKSAQITTIGIQHGAFGQLHMGYLFTKNDYDFGALTDYTMVWGEYWKSMLVEHGNYNPQRVICTGQIRTDVIPELKNHIANEDGAKESKQKIVVFATQIQPDEGLRKRAAEDAFSTIKGLTNTTLVLKLHPREYAREYYHDIARSIGCTNYHIDTDSDLYSLLATCDILLTCYSTVGGEGVYFDKPLIILDYLQQDFCGYLQEGVALQATNAQELEFYIKGFLNGDIKIQKEAYEQFKTNYAYKIDGNVSERCLDFIKSV